MVCTANDLLEWKDFPKGLRVLLLDEDKDSANEIKAKLEEMEYIVFAFFSENEALSAISNKADSFDVAVIEVSVHNSNQRYKFLEIAKDLPTIMTSNEQCLSIMMKCIALGAVEFLIKPLSEDKLRNIWQHVVHKAFNSNASCSEASESLKSIKEFVGSVLEIQQQSITVQNQVLDEPNDGSPMSQNDPDPSPISDKFPAPSTPQLEQGGRFLDDGEYQEQPNNSPVKDSGEIDGETKFVNTTISDSDAMMEMDPPQPTAEMAIKEEDDDHHDGSKDRNYSLSKPHDKEDATDLVANNGNSNKESASQNLCKAKGNKKKAKVDWTPDLHKKFVQAVEKLGVDQAIPSKILELMKVEGLTRHNVASHLQKYRMHRRHILPKEENRQWPLPMNYYPHQPVIAFPSYQTHHTFTPGQVYPMWGPQGGQLPGFPMWGPPSYPNWQPMENWQWKPSHPRLHADAWGCPVLPPSSSPSSPFPVPQVQQQGVQGFQSPDHRKNFADLHPGEEVLDKMVKEAISNPWLPLPIGLKPPSTESVLAELCRQGISVIPTPINGRHPC